MGYYEFSPWGNKSIIVEFDCDNCGQRVISEQIAVPSPNYMAEKASDSHGENEDYVVCEKCDKDFTITVYAGMSDGYIEIDDVDDETISIQEITSDRELETFFDFQINTIIESTNYLSTFQDEILKLKKLNEVNLENDDLQETLLRQIFSGAITCLEDYLSTTIIQNVLNNENYFKQFVKTFRGIKGMKFELCEIYEKLDKLTDIVKKELINVIYHDLPKVKGMYQDTFKIEFPEIKELMKAIYVRHDLVHRNGKNKEGEKILLTKEKVVNIIDLVESFVKDLNERLDPTTYIF